MQETPGLADSLPAGHGGGRHAAALDKAQSPGARALASYALMAFPLAFAGLPVYLHAPDFYAVTVGASLTSLGLILLALRVIDALQDPLIGSLSDRYHDRRPAVIIAGAVLLGAGFWMIFHPTATLTLTWFAVSVFLCTTGFSVVTINLQALGGIWKTGVHDRTRITSWREAFGLIGLLAAAIGPALLGHASDPARAFHLLTLIYVPLLLVATVGLLAWMRTAPLSRPDVSVAAISWRAIVADPWRRRFFLLSLLNTFASAIPAVLVLFFIRDRLEAETYTGLFLLLYFLSGAASMALWLRVATGFGKVRAWALSMGVAIITFIWAAFLGPGDMYAYAAVCILSGLALGADLALPPSILADHIHRERRQREASRLFAFLTLLSKTALALATGLALPILGLVGYQPGAPMTPLLGLSLSAAYAVVPCALKALTLLWLLSAEDKITVT